MANRITASLQSVLSSLLPDATSCDLTWTWRAEGGFGMLTLTLYSVTHKRTLHWSVPDMSEEKRSAFSASLASIAAALSTIPDTMSSMTPLDAPASRKAKSPPEKPEKNTGKSQAPPSLFTDLFGTEGEANDG